MAGIKDKNCELVAKRWALALMELAQEDENISKEDILDDLFPKFPETATREAVIEALKTVSDPEIMINIWDMGLVYKIEQKENADVYIEMTVTSPMCPVAGVLPQQAAEAVASLEGVGEVEVRIVWEPAWSLANLSDEAKEMFEMF